MYDGEFPVQPRLIALKKVAPELRYCVIFERTIFFCILPSDTLTQYV